MSRLYFPCLLMAVVLSFVGCESKTTPPKTVPVRSLSPELSKVQKVLLVAGSPDGEECDAELSFELATGVAERLRKEGFKAEIKADGNKAQPVEAVRILKVDESHKANQIADSLDADAVLFVALAEFDIESLEAVEATGRVMKVQFKYDGNGLLRILHTEPATNVTFDLSGEAERGGLTNFPHEVDEAKRRLARTAAVTNVFLSLGMAHIQSDGGEADEANYSMEYIPLILAIIVGVAGFGTMCVAFLQVWRQGGWQQAMALTSDGRWSSARRLMVIGAGLGAGFGLFIFALSVFGGLPWQS